MNTYSELREKIEAFLQALDLPQRKPALLYTPIYYTLQNSGKRIRPLLCCAACQAFNGGHPEPALAAAAALEVYHNFTLLHDDLMDNSPTRRGKPAVHTKWNANQAILSGDAMSLYSVQILSQYYRGKTLELILAPFIRLAIEICDGQQYDMDFEKRDNVKAEEYIEMIKLKTSVLLAGALQIGAIIGGAKEKDTSLIYEAGINMGLAFQLQDDWLDVYADEAVLGKPTGGDIANNKKTMMLIKAFELANPEQKKLLQEYMNMPWGTERQREKIAAVTALYNELKVGDVIAEMVTGYTNKAIDAFQQLSCGIEAIAPILDLTKKLERREK